MRRGVCLLLVALTIPGTVAVAGPGLSTTRNPRVPVVTITSPAKEMELSGIVSITANVVDRFGLTAVAFNIDGGDSVMMSTIDGATWRGSWNSATVTNGPHIVCVGALNVKGYVGVSQVGVTIFNTVGPVWPDSMAAIGDSITRGVFADNSINGLAEGQPEHSWAAGWDGGDIVVSHYERILGENGAILGSNYNNAVSGARMDDFLAQANATIPQNPDYVLVFLGHNDLCRDTVSEIPTDAQFETWFRQGIDALLAGLPNAKIVVLEIIDVAQLWDCCSNDGGCLFSWLLFGPCGSVTGSNSTDRAIVRQRTIGFNDILRNVCAEKGVIFEDRIFEQVFTLSDVSDLDCFHPSVNGHRKIAEGSWDATRF